jgi:hypothetical protein
MSNPRKRRPLTEFEWGSLVEKYHQITVLMRECEEVLGKTLTVAKMGPYYKAFGRMQSLKSRLENLADEGGQDGMALLYGSRWTYCAHWR